MTIELLLKGEAEMPCRPAPTQALGATGGRAEAEDEAAAALRALHRRQLAARRPGSVGRPVPPSMLALFR